MANWNKRKYLTGLIEGGLMGLEQVAICISLQVTEVDIHAMAGE